MDITRGNIARFLKSWGGARGAIAPQLGMDVSPVVVLDEGWPMPVFEPWSFSRVKVGAVGFNSLVGIYNKDPRPDDVSFASGLGPAQAGGGGSIVIIDHIRFSCSVQSDIIAGIVDSSLVLTPNSAAAMNAAFQQRVGPPYKVTGVGFGDNAINGVVGDQTLPYFGLPAKTPSDLKVNIYLGPGHAWVMQPLSQNADLTVWARGRYYPAP